MKPREGWEFFLKTELLRGGTALCPNIWVIEVSEGNDSVGEGQEKYFKKIMVKYLPNLMKTIKKKQPTSKKFDKHLEK